MIQSIYESSEELFAKGGWVMWPLLGLSLVALSLAFERFWFFLGTNSITRRSKVAQMAALMRAGHFEQAKNMAAKDRGVYGRITKAMLEEPGNDAAAVAAVEEQRHRLERFMPTLSTIITAAPMLGILGTVTGIISSFQLLSDQAKVTPNEVSGGIAEALLTTAAGLIVALVVLFPYNAFRAQIDRTLGRIEALIAAASVGAQSRRD